jgi:hypothetical protein
MKYRLANPGFAFVRGLTVVVPGARILDVRVGTSRVAQPQDWADPVYRLDLQGERAVVRFDRPDNWAHFGIDLVLDAPAGFEAQPQAGMDLVAPRPLEQVKAELASRRILFLGTARDCAAALPAAIRRLGELGGLFASHAIMVFENDSKDATGELLDAWAAEGRLTSLREPGLHARMPLRTERLAHARNRLLDRALAEDLAGRFDYVCWADLDGLVGERFDTDGFLSNFTLDEVWDAVFPVSWPLYYDLWALREDTIAPTDYMHDTECRVNAVLGDAGKLHAATQQLQPARMRGWLPVRSAFGGFGLYKAGIVARGRYVGLLRGREVCEHVPYHEALGRAGARLYINPRCITHIA